MKSTIYGSGANSKVTLYRIHHSGCYFQSDTSTKHSQVVLLQNKLNTMGYNCGTADGKYGTNTVNGVKAFQRANNLTVDGKFGKASLEKLEELNGGTHLDTTNCTNSGDVGAYGCYDKTDASLKPEKYKVSSAMRIKLETDAVSRINSYGGTGNVKTVAEFLSRLETDAANLSCSYNTLDCAGYIKKGRYNQGASGASSELATGTEYFGSIHDLGGYDNLIVGMEIFQGFRKTSGSNRFYASHIGVYYGKYDFGNGPVHAVYQSSSSYPSLKKKYNKTSGPNLTEMRPDVWNYWGWSKYIKV